MRLIRLSATPSDHVFRTCLPATPSDVSCEQETFYLGPHLSSFPSNFLWYGNLMEHLFSLRRISYSQSNQERVAQCGVSYINHKSEARDLTCGRFLWKIQ